MKVGIYESVEVSNEQRKAIAETLGQKTATRDDLKAFVWKYGEQWPLMVDKPQSAHPYVDQAQGDPATDVDDLIGDASGDVAEVDDDLASLI